MKLTSGTVQVLKNFSTINKGIVIKPGKDLRTIISGRSMIAEVRLNDELPQYGAIYDVGRFLGAMSLFEDPDLSFKEDSIVIHEGKQAVTYVYSEPSTILTPKDDQVNLPDPDVVFDLSWDELTSLMRGAQVLNLPSVYIALKDGELIIEATNPKSDHSDAYRLDSVDVISGTTDCEFRLSLEYFKFLPCDYRVSISTKGLAKFEATDTKGICEDVVYWIGTEKR